MRLAALRLHDELRDAAQQVVLVPAPQPKHAGHMVRVCVSGLPAWYTRLGASTRKRRRRARARSDPDLRRPLVLRALARLADGAEVRHRYDELLLPVLRVHAAQFTPESTPF